MIYTEINFTFHDNVDMPVPNFHNLSISMKNWKAETKTIHTEVWPPFLLPLHPYTYKRLNLHSFCHIHKPWI
jgi:hypothetical protein